MAASHFAILSVLEGTTSGLLTIAVAAGIHALAKFRRSFSQAIAASTVAQAESVKAATASRAAIDASREATGASREASEVGRANAQALTDVAEQLRSLTGRMDTMERLSRARARRRTT